MSRTTFALVDPRLVEDTYLLRRAVEPPELKRAEPVLQPGQAYGSVLRGRDGWRMYYLLGQHRHDAEHAVDRFEYHEHRAVSRDGLTWDTPPLGLVEVAGSRDNNVVMATHYRDASGMDLTGGSGPEGFCVLDAEQANVPHARSRFTALYLASPADRYGGLCLAHSADGRVWTGYPENPVIPGWHDTQAVMFFDPRLNRYVLYTRPPVYAGKEAHANRKVARAQSEDLIRWTVPRVVLDTDEGDAPGTEAFAEPKMPAPRGRDKQFYGMTPFVYGGLYLGLAWLYDARAGTMHVELVHSFDGIDWKREPGREPFITAGRPLGDGERMVVTAANPPIAVGDELWVYASTTRRTHHGKATPDTVRDLRMMLLTLKRDRWVGYAAGEREGTLLSAPFEAVGGKLTLNTVIADGGEAAVSFTDELGLPLSEYHLDEIPPLRGPLDAVDAPIAFGPGPKSVLRFPTRGQVRLRVKLRKAKLFGWAFE